MDIVVHKYGGTSVGSIDRLSGIVQRIQADHKAGLSVVVVLSAMTGQTDQLLHLATEITDQPDPQALDLLLSTGEQVSVALLSMALRAQGMLVSPYLGWQLGIYTDTHYGKARLLGINAEKMRADLEAGSVVVIAGFQGVDPHGYITTLGRGGSDTTAVACAAVLGASCRIYTDVDGVYSADPRMCTEARRLEAIDCAQMLDLATSGTRVLDARAVECAWRYAVPTQILSCFMDGRGTQLSMEAVAVRAITLLKNRMHVSIMGIPADPALFKELLEGLQALSLSWEGLFYEQQADGYRVSVSMGQEQGRVLLEYLERLQNSSKYRRMQLSVRPALVQLTLLATGWVAYSEKVLEPLDILMRAGLAVQSFWQTGPKVSVLLDEKDSNLAYSLWHSAFECDKE